jgi:hypothetical protein
MKKLWYIKTMKYNSRLKRNELSSHSKKVKEASFLKGYTLFDSNYCSQHSRKGKNYEDSEKIRGCQGLRKEKKG